MSSADADKMQVSQILNSAAIRFLRLTFKDDGGPYLPEVTRALQEHFRFWEAPTKLADFDWVKGVHFLHGRILDTVIGRLVIFDNRVLVESSASTDKLDGAIDYLAEWASQRFDMRVVPGGPIPRLYVSALEVTTSASLARLADFRAFGTLLTNTLKQYQLQPPTYELTSINFSRPGLGRFLFERREGRPFEDNCFYSVAPVSTDEHVQLLEELEKLL